MKTETEIKLEKEIGRILFKTPNFDLGFLGVALICLAGGITFLWLIFK
ncbi:MAG: hypothetical protein PHD43_23330 [Methylococcales bacterium]|nr:hypothetical protein [Candidatus Paceibacterota bacterium]MDD5323481.1 hypothetical protein [Methylococcales bacterium]